MAFGVVLGQVSQNVSLPLWLSALEPADTGPFFVVWSASAFYVVLFGLWHVARMLTSATSSPFIRWNDQPRIALVGALDAANGLLVVYASPANRTAPFLQSILGNFTIPLTVFFRWIILRKEESMSRLICAGLVFVSLFVAVAPSILGLDPNAAHGSH